MSAPLRRYPAAMMVLHWVTVVVILVAYFLSAGEHRVRLHPALWHFAFGLSVLVLVAARLVARAAGAAPPLQLQNRSLLGAAKLGHLVLYLLLIAVPLSGWFAASRLGIHAWFFGLVLPPLTTVVATHAGLIGKLHQLGGNLILILAGLHAAIALWHQFVWRDGTLQRMLPY
ncbi:MAG TPA: cytochrome b/b6 domain-containing protein [Steroidobacteraceae bacterium]|nr:cytochrome b/b6 domain-containing protein [Steroidobacteraceae bacterium]